MINLIRRRNRDEESVLSEISNLKLWFKADEGITKDGGNYVSQWNDQSGISNNATQTTYGIKPLWVDNQINGFPVVRFDGNDWMVFSDLILAKCSVFIVYKKFASNSASCMIGNGYNNNYSGVFDWDNTQIYFNTEITQYSVNGGGKTVYSLIECINESVPLSIYMNGNLVSQVNMVGSLNIGNIGRSIGIANSQMDGDIAEIIVYDSALSTTNRQLVELYINTKYNIW